ncbi:MAG TPA: hypothetical protein DIV86_01415 [Alphaproteobacteria bacterium]|nr:hypothetical protein [Alphaproteobacteria bacterium]
MKKILNGILLLASASLLASCSVTSVEGGTKAATQKGGILGLVTQDDVKTEAEGAFKGANEVIIASFKVAFYESKKDRAKAGMGYGGASTAKSELKGVSDAVRQEITNAAYADFVKTLKASGYKIADRSELLNDKDFSGAKAYDFPYDDDGIKYYSPAALGNKAYFFLGESADFSGGFAFGNAGMSAANFAEKNGKAVISALYTIDFLNADGDGNSRWASTSTMQVGQGISVKPGSKIVMTTGHGGPFSPKTGNVSLGQPVYSTKEFGTIKNTSSDAYKAAETALNIASALLGGGTNQTRSFEVTANPSKYKAVAADVIKDTNKALVAKMAGLR